MILAPATTIRTKPPITSFILPIKVSVFDSTLLQRSSTAVLTISAASTAVIQAAIKAHSSFEKFKYTPATTTPNAHSISIRKFTSSRHVVRIPFVAHLKLFITFCIAIYYTVERGATQTQIILLSHRQ